MSGEYRITVRGAMSERFCQGFPGLTHRVLADSHRPGGRPAHGAPSPTCSARSTTSVSRSSRSSRPPAPPHDHPGGLTCHALPHSLTRRPWRVILIAIVVFAVAVVVGGPAHVQPHGHRVRGPRRRVRRGPRPARGGRPAPTPGPGVVALVEPGTDVRTGAGRAAVEKAAATIAADPDVASVVTAFNGGGAALVSTDGDASYVAAFFKPISDDAAAGRGRAHPRRRSPTSPDVTVGGVAMVGEEAGTIIGEDLAQRRDARLPDHLPALPLGLPRGDRRPAALADGRPGDLRLVPRRSGSPTRSTTLSVYALNLAIGLSLGLAIDYSLLIVSRYREEMARHGPGQAGPHAHPADRRQERAVRGDHRGRGPGGADGLPAALPLLDGPRRRAGGADRGGGRPAGAAGGAGAARHRASTRSAPKSWQRHSEEADQEITSGFWYRLSQRRDAPPGADRGRHHGRSC